MPGTVWIRVQQLQKHFSFRGPLSPRPPHCHPVAPPLDSVGRPKLCPVPHCLRHWTLLLLGGITCVCDTVQYCCTDCSFLLRFFWKTAWTCDNDSTDLTFRCTTIKTSSVISAASTHPSVTMVGRTKVPHATLHAASYSDPQVEVDTVSCLHLTSLTISELDWQLKHCSRQQLHRHHSTCDAQIYTNFHSCNSVSNAQLSAQIMPRTIKTLTSSDSTEIARLSDHRRKQATHRIIQKKNKKRRADGEIWRMSNNWCRLLWMHIKARYRMSTVHWK